MTGEKRPSDGGKKISVHIECLAVMFMYQCDPGNDEDVPIVCGRCTPHQREGEALAEQLLAALFAREDDRFRRENGLAARNDGEAV